MTREEIYAEIKEKLGRVAEFYDQMDDAKLEYMWSKIKRTFLSETSLGFKVNALVCLAAAYAVGCKY